MRAGPRTLQTGSTSGWDQGHVTPTAAAPIVLALPPTTHTVLREQKEGNMCLFICLKRISKKRMPNVVVHAYELSTSEAEAGELLSV